VVRDALRAGDVRGDASMEIRRCAGCGEAFRPRSQVPQQRYCGADACQRARRDAGNGRGSRATLTIARTRRWHSASGPKIIANTGTSTGPPTRSTARATVTLPGSGSAIGGGARRSPMSLQRWTRQPRNHPYRQALIGSSRRVLQGLQRWTRGRWKSLWSQSHTGRQGQPAEVCKERT
jgi:hypothetical protein